MVSCYEEISKNIQQDCANPLVAGYTGRALLFPFGSVTVTRNATNKRIIDVTPIAGKTFYAVDNVFVDPFTGSSKQSTGDSGRIQYQKTLQVRIPMRGAVVSEDIIEPMMNSAHGYLLICEKKQKSLEGGFEAIGVDAPMKPTADGTTQNESENGGDVVMILQTVEPYFECDYRYGATPATPSYAETVTRFDALYAAAGTAWVEPAA